MLIVYFEDIFCADRNIDIVELSDLTNMIFFGAYFEYSRVGFFLQQTSKAN